MPITECARASRQQQSGLSLIELVISIVVLSIGLVALLIPLTNATRHSGDPLVTKQMIAIAEAMLEEIELKPFGPGTYGGPYNCFSRAQFDAVNPDYNGFATVGVCDITGAPIPSLAGYNTSVALTQPLIAGYAAGSYYVITVSVTGPNGTTVTLSGVRSNYY
jgi:MSHA pilin protein MshD